MERLIVYETDRGNYAVRPECWAGILDKDGRIKECGLNHTAIFHYKEDAEWYAEAKNAEEQGLLLRLPCKIGDDVYQIPSKVNYDLNVLCKHEENNRVCHQKVARITITDEHWFLECDKDIEYGTDRICLDIFYKKTWFLSKEEAEAALARMEEGNE